MNKEKHICNPQEGSMFELPTYQCGCGRYFNKDEAIKQSIKWLKYHRNLFKEGMKE